MERGVGVKGWIPCTVYLELRGYLQVGLGVQGLGFSRKCPFEGKGFRVRETVA